MALNEAAGVGAPSVGFVFRILFDRWSYLISLKDFFDSCGFTLFADEHGIIYESHPHSVVGRAARTPTASERER